LLLIFQIHVIVEKGISMMSQKIFSQIDTIIYKLIILKQEEIKIHWFEIFCLEDHMCV